MSSNKRRDVGNPFDRAPKIKTQSEPDITTPDGFMQTMLGIPNTQQEIIEVIPKGAIVPAGEGRFVINGWEMTPTGLIPPESYNRADWEIVVNQIKNLSGVMQWVIGDLLNIGTQYGITYQEFAEATGYEVKTLYNLKSIAANVPLSVRFPAPLTIGHHAEVARLDLDSQYEWLKWAYENKATIKDLREQLNGKPDSTSTGSKLDKIYQTILKNVTYVAKNAEPQQRRIMAQQLRQMADELEK